MSAMKRFSQILATCACILLLVLVGYAFFKYLVPHWVALIFYCYVIVGVFVLSFGTIRISASSRRAKTAQEQLYESLRTVFSKTDIMTRVRSARDLIAALASALAGAIIWPVDTWFGFRLGREAGDKALSAEYLALNKSTGVSQHSYSLFALAITVVTFGLTYRGVRLEIYGPLTLYMMLCNVMLRHLQYFSGTTSLPAILRRTNANPYLLFLLILAADYLTLLLTLTALGHSGSLSTVTLQELRGTSREMLNAKDPLMAILRGQVPGFHRLLVTTAGLGFGLAITKAIFDFKECQRQDEDYAWLAAVDIRLGNFASALRHLGNLTSFNQLSQTLEMVAQLGVNEIAEAEKVSWELIETAKAEQSKEVMFCSLYQCCVQAPIPETVHTGLIRRAIELQIEDVLLQDTLSILASVPSEWPAVNDILSKQQDTYPLSFARLLFLEGKWADCFRQADSAARPAPLDEIVRLNLLLCSKLSETATDDEAAQVLEDYAALLTPKIRELAKANGKLWERMLLFEEIERTLVLARAAKSSRVQELDHLADVVKAGTSGDQATRGFKLTELLMSHASAAPS